MNIFMFIAVVTVHVLSWTLTDMNELCVDKASWQYASVFSVSRLLQFVVQGFIFLSAVKLFSSKKEMNYEKFLLGRYKSIILPYIVWNLIYYAYFIKFYGYVFSFGQLAVYLFLGTLCSHFYFIVIIMQFYFNMPVFKWLFGKVNMFVLSAVSVVLTALFKQYVHFEYSDRVLPAFLCYFVIGAAVGMNYEKVTAALEKLFYPICAVFGIFAFADVYLIYRANAFGIVFGYIEVLHIFFCISAIFFLFAFCIKVARGRELPKFVKLLDRSSYMIYLSHILFIYIAKGLVERLEISGTLERLLFRAIFTFATTVGFCMLYTWITEKIKNGRKTA